MLAALGDLKTNHSLYSMNDQKAPLFHIRLLDISKLNHTTLNIFRKDNPIPRKNFDNQKA
mgnify:CR=1 FL=1